MEEHKLIEPTEKVKFTRGASGKYGYEITLLGKPEDNLERLKELKEELNKLWSQENSI
jgi:hypothetical protein